MSKRNRQTKQNRRACKRSQCTSAVCYQQGGRGQVVSIKGMSSRRTTSQTVTGLFVYRRPLQAPCRPSRQAGFPQHFLAGHVRTEGRAPTGHRHQRAASLRFWARRHLSPHGGRGGSGSKSVMDCPVFSGGSIRGP